MPEISARQGAGQEERSAELTAMSTFARAELDNGARALMGMPMPSTIFGSLTGLDPERAQQFERFTRGELQSISGNGMGERNLQRLEELKGVLAGYGVEVQVNGDERSFTLTNSNYIPLGLMGAEERLFLVKMNNDAANYLEMAGASIASGDLQAAEGYLQAATSMQARYSEYVEGLRTLEMLGETMAELGSVPRTSLRQEKAMELLGSVSGTEINSENFQPEFQRLTGISWEEFQEGGFEAIARKYYSEAESIIREGLAGIRDGTLETAMPSFARAQYSADYATGVVEDIYRIIGIRRVADGVRGLSFTGAEGYSEELGAERRRAAGLYSQAESSLTESLFLRALTPESDSVAAQNIDASNAFRVESASFLARAEGKVQELAGRYEIAAEYSRVQEGLMQQDFSGVDAVAQSDLIAQRDAIFDALSTAVREGRRLEDVDERIRGLSYAYAEAYWAEFRFDGVHSAAAVEYFERRRGELLDGLASAIQGGGPMRDLKGREQQLLGDYGRCVDYERLVDGLYQSGRQSLAALAQAENEFETNVTEVVNGVPTYIDYEVYAPTPEGTGTRERSTHSFAEDKQKVFRTLFGDRGQQIESQLASLDEWHQNAFGYLPPELIHSDVNPESTNLMERFAVESIPQLDGFLQVQGNVERFGREFTAATSGAQASITQFYSTVNEFIDVAKFTAFGAGAMDAISSAAAMAVGIMNIEVIFAGASRAGSSIAAWADTVSPAFGAVVRTVPTLASVGMSAWGATEFTDGWRNLQAAETPEERMQASEQMLFGALGIGSLGIVGRLPGTLLKMTTAVSRALDVGALATLAPSVAVTAWSSYEAGDSGFDVARNVFFVGMAAYGAWMGIRVPGGVRVAMREGEQVIEQAGVKSIDALAESIRAQPNPLAARGFAGEAAGARMVEAPPVSMIERQALEMNAQAGRAATELAPAARAPAQIPPTVMEMPAPQIGRTVVEAAPAAAEGRAVGRAVEERVMVPVQEVRAAEFRQATQQEEPIAALGNYLHINGVRGRVNFPPAATGLAEGQAAFRDTFSGFIRDNPRIFEISGPAPMRIGETEMRFGNAFECEGRTFVPVYVTKGGETNIEFFYRSTSQTSWRLASHTEMAGSHLSKGISEQLQNAPAAVQHRLTEIAQDAGAELPAVDGLSRFLPDTRLNPAEAGAASDRLMGAQGSMIRDTRTLDTSNPGNWPDFPTSINRSQIERLLAGEMPPGMGGLEAVTLGSDAAHGDYVLATVLSKNSEYRYNMVIYGNGEFQVASIEATRGSGIGAIGLPTTGVEISSGMTREQAADILRGRFPGTEPGERAISDFMSGADKSFSEIVFAPRLQYGDQVEVLTRYRDAFGISVSTASGYGGYRRVVIGAAEGAEMNPFLRGMEESGGRFSEAMESALPGEARISIASERSRIAGSTYTQEQYQHVMGAMEERRFYVIGEMSIRDEAQGAMQIYESAVLERARSGISMEGFRINARMGTGSDELMLVVGYENKAVVMRADLSDLRRQSGIGSRAAGDASIQLRMDEINNAITGAMSGMRRGASIEEVEVELARALEGSMETGMRQYGEYAIAGQGRTLADVAPDLAHPESLAQFKFDMTTIDVTAGMEPGFLNRALSEASASGSSAHGRAVADALEIPLSPVFRSSESIRAAQPGEAFTGTGFQLSARYSSPESQQTTEIAYGAWFEGLSAEERASKFTRREIAAMQESMDNFGFIPMPDIARYGYRKGVGQLTPTDAMHEAVGVTGATMQMRARAGNSSFTEQGMNTVATAIDNTVAAYAERNGLTIVRANENVAPDLGYIMVGVNGAEAQRHLRQMNLEIDAALERYGLASSGYTTAEVANASLAQIDSALLSNALGVRFSPQMVEDGEYVVAILSGGSERRAQELLGDWPGGTQLKETIRTMRVRTLSDLAAVDRPAFDNLMEFVRTYETNERIIAVRNATQGVVH